MTPLILKGTAKVAEAVLAIVRGTTNGPIFLGFFSRVLSAANITFSIDSNNIIKVTAEDINNPLNKKCIQVSANKQNLSDEKIQEIINNANILNEKDKIDKFKKESHLSILDDSKKILEKCFQMMLILNLQLMQ